MRCRYQETFPAVLLVTPLYSSQLKIVKTDLPIKFLLSTLLRHVDRISFIIRIVIMKIVMMSHKYCNDVIPI